MTDMERRMIRSDFLLQEGIHLPDKQNIEDVEMFDLSPIHCQQFCRLEKAKNIVPHTNLPFSQIADTLGFESLSAFTRAFAKQFTQPSSAYRQRLRGASWQE